MTITYTLEDITSVAKQIIETVSQKIILFNGSMGAGKTTLITEICKQLGVTDTISSPTYSLVNEYLGEDSVVYHFDFYRIEHEEEAYQIGFEEYLDRDAWVFIEWPERVQNLLPENVHVLELKEGQDARRTITLSNYSNLN